MEFEKINITAGSKKVLVAPLDWGLGHATRCIPIIYALLQQHVEVIIAADGAIKNLLKKEFPNVVFTQLKGYNIRYSSNGFWLPLRLLAQLPKFVWAVYTEHKWLKKIVLTHNIDTVISDNRLGLYHSKIYCIYITHQLKIKTGNRFATWLAQKTHYFFINKYRTCWVPDNESENFLAGELSHPKKLPVLPIKYLGPLSRFEKIIIEKKYDLLILLSGPEPQRTIFETILLKQLKIFTGSVLLVRGLPLYTNKTDWVFENNLTIVNHLTANELNKAIQQSALVISRSGYTTIMDLVKLEQKAILVATPGQTEQEYLAAYLKNKNIFFSASQKGFSLNEILQNAAFFSYAPFVTINTDGYKKIVADLVKQL